MTDIVDQVAKAMFEKCHGYHPDLNWDNAYQAHKDIYLKNARIAYDVLHDHFTTGDYLMEPPADTSWVKFE